MINLLILLIICIVIFQCVVYNIQYRCPRFNLKIEYIRGSRLPARKLIDLIGIPTIPLKFDRDVECGIYRVTTVFGNGSLWVTKSDKRLGYLNLINFDKSTDKSIDKANILDIWDLTRMDTGDNPIINTFNRGCC
jgi:hypothetical protein